MLLAMLLNAVLLVGCTAGEHIMAIQNLLISAMNDGRRR